MKLLKKICLSFKYSFQFIKYIYSHNKKIILFIILEGLTDAIIPYPLLLFTKEVINSSTNDKLIIHAIIYLSIFAISNIIKVLVNTYLSRKENYQLLTKLANEYYIKTMYVKYVSLNDNTFLDKMNFAKQFVNGRCNQFIFKISLFVSAIFNLVFSIVLLIQLEYFTVLIILLYVIVDGIFKFNYLRIIRNNNIEKNKFERKHEYYLEIKKNIKFYKDIFVYDLNKKIDILIKNNLDKIIFYLKKNYKLTIIYNFVTTLIETGCLIAIYFLIINRIVMQTHNLGYFVIALSLINTFKNGLLNSQNLHNDIIDNSDYFNYYVDYINTNEYECSKGILISTIETIEFKNVSFSYSENSKKIISNLNLKISKGQKIAVIGENGCGKTTFIGLILGIYEPTEGSILINGIELNKIDRDNYLSLVTGISQKFSLFAYKISENVSRFDEYIEDNKYNEALKQSGLNNLLANFPEQDETFLYKIFSNDGINPSGGEAQLIAFARSLYLSNPSLYIFDEPTSSMDAINELNLYKHYSTVVENRISLFVSHRISCIDLCEYTLFFNKDNIIFDTKEKVLENKKIKDLYNTYLNSYQDKRLNVLIIDSGINIEHPKLKDINISSLNSNIKNKKSYGHGNAILGIILKDITLNNYNFYSYEINQIENGITDIELLNVLNYVYNLNKTFDVINISFGIIYSEYLNEIEEVCDKLYKKGSIIISAFSNDGAITYPAAFKHVIGVSGDSEIKNQNVFTYYNSEILNIAAFNRRQKLYWNNPDYLYLEGNSFSCAKVTNIVLYIMQNKKISFYECLEELKKRSAKIIDINDFDELDDRIDRIPFKINRAIILGYNKETKNIIKFRKDLSFEIVGISDTKYSIYNNKKIDEIDKDLESDYLIQNIETVDFSNIDTVIIGHLNDRIKPDYLEKISNLFKKNNLNIYCFDSSLKNFFTNYAKYFYPSTYIKNEITLNMLFSINKPIILVCGTSSNQGKFNVQIELRKRFIEQGYDIGQIGSEPNSLLFDFNYCIPMGYKAETNLNDSQLLKYLNYSINKLAKDNDIIIVGSQANSLNYSTNNIQQYNLLFYSFIQGVNPDLTILVVNYFDDLQYIIDTISFIENINKTIVIGVVISNINNKQNYMDNFRKNKKVDIFELKKRRELLTNSLHKLTFIFGIKEEMDELFNLIINKLLNAD